MESDLKRILAHLYEALILATLAIQRANEHNRRARAIIDGEAGR